MSDERSQQKERTLQEILATGAAWVTEMELQRLVEQYEARTRAWHAQAKNLLDAESLILALQEQYKVLKSSEAQAWNKAQFEKDRADTLQQAGVLISEERDGLLEQLQAERREEWREGIVNVLDHEGNYLGCMGSETWAWTLDGGIKRMKEQLEAAQLNITAYREINRWALSTKRCDAPSPQGDLLCDREPGHDGNHVNWQATEWKASGEDHWASREFAKVKEDLKNLPGYVRRAASYPAISHLTSDGIEVDHDEPSDGRDLHGGRLP